MRLCFTIVLRGSHRSCAMGRWVHPHGGPIDLFLVPASSPQLLQQRPWYVPSCLWDDAFKVANIVAEVGFSSLAL